MRHAVSGVRLCAALASCTIQEGLSRTADAIASFSQLLHRRGTAGEVLRVWTLEFMSLNRREGKAASIAFKPVHQRTSWGGSEK
jgi:hypothetical protein